MRSLDYFQEDEVNSEYFEGKQNNLVKVHVKMVNCEWCVLV